MLVALRFEDIIEIGLRVAPRARELRGRAGFDIGQEVHLAIAHLVPPQGRPIIA
jgi:hypothetical protein